MNYQDFDSFANYDDAISYKIEQEIRNERIEQENMEYAVAKCRDPHPDGSQCRPEWDGIMFICFDRIQRERNQ